MKYKRLIIVSSVIVGIILLFVILSYTLFTVQMVGLHFKNDTKMYVADENRHALIDSGEIPNNVPIYALNKGKIIENIEKKHPYVQVVNIETVFPNRLIIHCAEREEVFYIKSSDDMYYVCDNELKILSKQSKITTNQNDAILLGGVNISNNAAQIGEHLNLLEGEDEVKALTYAFMSVGKNISDFKAMFKSVKLVYEVNYYTSLTEPCFVLTTYDNFEVKLCAANANLNLKAQLAVGIIPKVANKYDTHKLVIDINPQDLDDKYVVLEKIQQDENV